ncbi:TetR/AcrR family transcriptional regulator [Actinomadura luteofluorescens]|uniref:TetR/AcrR family transcriptional regulator n=1 Tax=Actinomadura luteofluorescens TaxID=46163 RepID=UPI00363DB7E1
MGDAGLGAVADAAGVTRQTVYAHFPSREKLLLALAERLTGETVAAMDAADPEAGPAADALVRLLDAAARAAGRHPALTRRISAVPVSTRADHERHEPVADRIGRVIERGGAAASSTTASRSAGWSRPPSRWPMPRARSGRPAACPVRSPTTRSASASCGSSAPPDRCGRPFRILGRGGGYH